MIKITLKHSDFSDFVGDASVDLPVVPRAGDYIQYGVARNYKVVSVHFQPNYDGAVAVLHRIHDSAYDAVWRGDCP